MKGKMVVIGIGALTLFVASVYANQKEGYALTIQEYVRMALDKSLRSQTANDSFLARKWAFAQTNRGLTWPQLAAEARETRSGTDSDAGVETDAESTTAELSLTQPFLTDTDVTLSGVWTESETETDTAGVLSESQTRERPRLAASLRQNLPIFEGNQKWRQRKIAALGWENDQDQYRKTRLQIEFDAKSIYYNLLLQKESLAVEKRKFESAKLVHDITKALVRAGSKPKVEALRADVRAEADKRRLKNAEIALDQALNSAKDFALIPLDQTLVLKSELKYKPFLFQLEDLLLMASSKNPDLRVAQRNVELQEIGLKRTKEGDNPDFDLTGSYVKTLDRSDSAAPRDPTSWSVSLNMGWPFFDATQTLLAVKQAEVSLRNTQRSLESQERNLEVDIKNRFLDVVRTEDQIKSFSKQRETAEKSLNAIRLQYRNGYARLTDVFDAENQLRDLDLEYLRLLVDYNVARDRLALLIGVDLSRLRPGVTP